MVRRGLHPSDRGGRVELPLQFQGYSTQVNPSSLDPVNPQFVMFSTATFFYGVDGFASVQVPNYSGGNLLAGSDPGRVTLPSGAFRVAASSSVAVTLQVSAEPLAQVGAQSAGAGSGRGSGE